MEAKREREREGGPWCGVAWSSAAAWCRCGSGPTVVLAGGVLPRDSVKRRGRRDADRRG
jgi:hypothetical protein